MKTAIDEVVICGNTRQAQERLMHDYCKTKNFSYAKAYRNAIEIGSETHKVAIHYLSVNSNNFDGWQFRRISVDSSAIKLKYRDKLFKVIDACLAGNIVYETY